ncbi:hypothetical protein PSTG_19218 [Puccinia striiformis f. sp. tritici PST-78]|uniref:Uncharacterized protein n=1 Tax=Puccinia striiformis f. sp. tritici PST-78 TaxID=1165861 RepID=A0A0L0UJY5_9BASI|nr:hypothetical protein PSTG_19218 [Puccinia striiformis f. sp. tritici PST-78]
MSRDSNGKPRHNRHKRRNNGDNAEDTTVNAGFSNSKSGQRKKLFKRTIRDRPVWTAYSAARARFMAPPTNQPTTLTEIARCSKQAGKLNAENKEKGLTQR